MSLYDVPSLSNAPLLSTAVLSEAGQTYSRHYTL